MAKKLIPLIIVLGALVGAYYYVKNYVRAPFSLLEGQKSRVRRGDLVVPITASGHIRPASVTNIKSKASGEVAELPFNVGQMVRKGELIVRLDQTDEYRNVLRATAEFQRAVVAYEQATIRRREAREVSVPLAEAKLLQARAQEKLAQIEYAHQQELHAIDPGGAASRREYEIVEARYKQAEAATKAAEAELAQANLSVLMADKEVAAAEETRQSAQRLKEEAEERLKETKVMSPIDGMVVARHIQIGELVQSGKASLTGGTVLLEIADVSDIYAEVNVDEADIGLVRTLAPESALPGSQSRPATLPEDTIDTGQKVDITVEAYPDQHFEGVIERISPQSEVMRAIATFKVWIRIVSPNRHLLEKVLNTQAQANFTAKSVRNSLLVSYEAMKPDPNGDGYGVYVPHVPPGQTREEPKFVACKFGVDNRVDVEVIEGLSEGQEVYIRLPIKSERDQPGESRKRSADE